MFSHKSFSAKSFNPVSWLLDVVSEAVGGGVGYGYLDYYAHKLRTAPKVKKLVRRLARKAAQEVGKEASQDAQDGSQWREYIAALRSTLEREQIAWNRFYADLLSKQIDEQITAQIRLKFIQLGIYDQIRQDEDDEQALMLLFMDM